MRLLVIINEVMLRRFPACGLQLGPQGFVFQDAVEKRAAWVHAGSFGGKDPLGEQPQGLRIAFESAMVAHQVVERPLARMAEGRVAEVMGKADRFHQIRIDEEIVLQGTIRPRFEPLADRLADLRDFQRVCQPRAVEIILAAPEYLRLVLQSAECRRVQHPVAVDLERRAEIA